MEPPTAAPEETIARMTSIAAALFALAAAVPTPPREAGSSADARPLLEYTVRLADPRERAVDVTARFSGLEGEGDAIEVALPESFAFVRLDEPLLDGPVRAAAALGGRSLALERTGPFVWKLARGGASEATLSWRVPLRHQDLPAVKGRDGYEFPYVRDDHALLTMGAILLAPKLSREAVARVRFEAPAGWPVLCPWPRRKDGAYEPPSPRDLQDDLVGLGAWTARRASVAGMEIDVAFAPGQKKLEEMAGPAIEKIVAAEIALFGRAPRERYLFLFVAPEPVNGFMFAGSPKSGSMTLQVSGDLGSPVALEMVAHLVAHEFHHTWAKAGCDLPDELRFVNEGFTDWYAIQVPARCGIVPWERFADSLGEKIASYSRAAPAAGLSLADAGGPKFFEGGDAYAAVYSGGLVLAAILDLELRRAGKEDGLDGFLRRFVNDERFWPHRRPPTLAEFLDHVESESSRATRERIERLVRSPRGFDPAAELRASGAAIDEAKEAPSPRANFADGTRVTALDPAGEAGQLGVRSGDVLRRVNGVEVADAGAILRAWREPKDGALSVVLEREGKTIEVRAASPEPPVRYRLDATPWRR